MPIDECGIVSSYMPAKVFNIGLITDANTVWGKRYAVDIVVDCKALKSGLLDIMFNVHAFTFSIRAHARVTRTSVTI